MKIKKRDGRLEQLSFDKVIYRLRKLCNDQSLGILKTVDPDVVAQRVVSGIYDGVTSCELDEEAARIAINMTENPEYSKLASRIIVSNAHKSTNECFSEVMERLYANTDKAGNSAPILADDIIEIIRRHKNTLNFAIDYNRDYLFDYFGYKTLERSYLQKILDKDTGKMQVVERPQHLYMRVAVGIHKDNISAILKTYDLISQHYYTHASPTLFNAGTRLANLSSCYLIGTDDSIEGIYKTITDCGRISKVGGGIGVHITNIRGKGSLIRGTNGVSDGIIPMIKVYNETAKYINQSGKRKGSFACFVKDTKVCTVNDGVKNIQDIEIGDLVVTHKNRVRPVEQIHKNELGDRKIYKVSVIGNKDIYVTGNHKFWSFYTKKYKKNKLSFGWNSVEDLKTLIDNKKTSRQSCYVSMPTGTNIQNDTEYIIDIMDYKDILLNEPPIIRLISCKKDEYEKITPISESFDKNNNLKISHGQSINRKWIINDDLANLFGIWLGDGYIKKNKNYIRGIGFTVHNINKKLINYIINTSKKIFGCNITSYNSKNSNVTNVSINSHIVGKIFMTLFGSYFNGKRLPKMIFSWPKNLVNNLLAGLITTDGHIAKKKSNITLGLSNEELMNQIYHLCRNNGIKTTYLNKYIGKGQSCYNYVISIDSHKDIIDKIYKLYDDNRIQNCSTDNSTDYEFIKISSITETDRSDEYVYTLGVKDDHSYTVEGLLVENCYIEPWHSDILEFLDLKKNQGHEDLRARDLFYSLWIPDLFMKCVEEDGDWHLMCPDECPGLNDVYGEKFEALYEKYVQEGRYKRVIKAQEVWTKILDAQIETGTPYIGYKDAVNKKCNQKNLGTIRSSNLCSEISLYSDHKEYAVCFTGDTQILTKEGYRRIDECDNKDVLSYFNNDIEMKECQQFVNAKLIDNGIKDVFELECTGTKSVKATENHLFVVLDKRNHNTKTNKYKWVKLKDLTPNDKIILPKTNVLPNYDIDIIKSYDQDYLTVGWMLGDGWQSKSKNTERSIYGVCFGPNDIYARDIVINTLVKWCDDSSFVKNGYHRKSESFYTDKNGVYNWASSKQNFIKHIKDNYGLYEKTAHFKIIPDKIKQSQPIEIASFLSGLFSADGSVYIKYTSDQSDNIEKNNKFYINLSSSSKYLLDDVQQMLKCFAIESRTVFGDVKNRENQQGKLTIENKDSIVNFNKYINFILCKEKQQQLECGLKIFKKRNIFRSYVKLKSVKYLGKERVYDLNVPNTHNFIAEGFVVHNCNLASIALPKYVKYDNDDKPYFDFEHLRQISEYIIGPMNDVIDNNHYPVPETETSNMKHRPIGVGVQGLVDVYVKMRLPFESEGAKRLNKEIFETIYYGCLQGSISSAKNNGSYSSFEGSPFSEGKLQFDLAKEFDGIDLPNYISGRWDWDSLKSDMIKYGVRNSMLLALMPTASTAQIMGNTESIECFDSCIFKRRVLSGEYIVINKYLVEDLVKLGLWSKELKDTIIANDGSIQKIDVIPDDLKALYKTVWEISMKSVIEQASDRGVFVDQMQSMNLFMANPNYKRLTSMHFYAWKNHLKTGMYYLRSKSSYAAAKFSIDVNLEKSIREKRERGEELEKDEQEAILACSRDNPEACMLCSS